MPPDEASPLMGPSTRSRTVEIHGLLIPPPWGPLWVRGDANLDPEDE